MEEHLLTISDAELWNHFLPPVRSVFGSLAFAGICEQHRGVSARLYVIQSARGHICYPILLRPLSALPFQHESKWEWDSFTPDFTGPILSGSDPELQSSFPSLRDAMFVRERIVAEFVHLHPANEAKDILADGCEVNRDIVWVDTSMWPDELWEKHLEPSCRNKIRKAQALGVTVYDAASQSDIEEFCRIYYGTMKRNNALESFYFPRGFFEGLYRALPGNARYVLAKFNGKVVAATLFLYDEENIYSYLGGTDAAFQHLSPTNLLIWETIRWAHSREKKRLILGGGYRPNDGVFRFKASFSKKRYAFHVGKKIHNSGEYCRLEDLYRRHHDLNTVPISYFPAYRFVMQPKNEPVGRAS